MQQPIRRTLRKHTNNQNNQNNDPDNPSNANKPKKERERAAELTEGVQAKREGGGDSQGEETTTSAEDPNEAINDPNNTENVSNEGSAKDNIQVIKVG